MVNMQYSGLLGLIHLGLVIYAAISILGSGASAGAKTVWILVVLIFPLIGLIAWLIFGPRRT